MVNIFFSYLSKGAIVISPSKRIAFFSYPRLTKIISTFIPESISQVMVYEEVFEESLKMIKELIAQNTIDAAISAGGNGHFLKSKISEIPLFLIHVTIKDLLEGVKYLESQSEKICILGYEGSLPDLIPYQELVSFNFSQEWYRSFGEMEYLFRIMTAQGCDAFLGTSLVCDLATTYGYPAYMVYTRENVQQAFQEAFAYQRAIYLKTEREKRMEIVFNHTDKAFISIDNDRTIQMVNLSAEKLLGLPKTKLLGRLINEIMTTKNFDLVVKQENIYNNRVQTINGKKLQSTWIPIKDQNKITEVIITFSDISEMQQEKKKIKSKISYNGFKATYSFIDIVGSSLIIQDLIALAKSYADSNLPVLIQGETGTGKELFAQGIHNYSSRWSNPFVAVNCSAIPDELLESELFGYESGSFTGARKDGKTGFFEKADSGTLFLDEIEDLSPKGQAVLLRVLQERTIMKLGAEKIIPVDVRVIAATNQSLKELMKTGNFRTDLYYRLNVLDLLCPPLCKRRQDIPELVEHFIKMHGFETLGEATISVLGKTLEQAAYDWPGNIRELENVVIKTSHLLSIKEMNPVYIISQLLKTETPEVESLFYLSSLDEQKQILKVLENTHWNKSKAAYILGISRATLWRKLKDFGVN